MDTEPGKRMFGEINNQLRRETKRAREACRKRQYEEFGKFSDGSKGRRVAYILRRTKIDMMDMFHAPLSWATLKTFCMTG